MRTYVLNGYGPLDIYQDEGYMNGTNQLNGTNQVMQGTNQVMNGTNTIYPMNGTNAVVPMQGTNGEYYVSPLSMIDFDDVPMNGVPSDYDDNDVNAYRLAYMVGDPDALNGLFGKLKAKIKKAKAGNQDARNNRRENRTDRKEAREQRRKDGTRFIDKFGGAIANVGEALKMKLASGQMLEDSGIDYDDEVLDQRMMMSADAGATSDNKMLKSDGGAFDGLSFFDKVKLWWTMRSDVEKGLIVVGGGTVIYLGWRAYKNSRRKGKGRKK